MEGNVNNIVVDVGLYPTGRICNLIQDTWNTVVRFVGMTDGILVAWKALQQHLRLVW